jgi:hypothetical protein
MTPLILGVKAAAHLSTYDNRRAADRALYKFRFPFLALPQGWRDPKDGFDLGYHRMPRATGPCPS